MSKITTIRIDQNLHDKVSEIANKDGRSFNYIVVKALEAIVSEQVKPVIDCNGDVLIEAEDKPKQVKQVKASISVYVPFDRFWAVWPKKVAKEPARKAWDKLRVGENLFREIESHLAVAYQQTDKQFIPHPATYLNERRWTDEIIAAPVRGFDGASWERPSENFNIYDGELN